MHQQEPHAASGRAVPQCLHCSSHCADKIEVLSLVPAATTCLAPSFSLSMCLQAQRLALDTVEMQVEQQDTHCPMSAERQDPKWTIWGSVLGLTGRAVCLCECGWGQRCVGSAAWLFFSHPMPQETKAQLSPGCTGLSRIPAQLQVSAGGRSSEQEGGEKR